jgi:hypothetical protein
MAVYFMVVILKGEVELELAGFQFEGMLQVPRGTIFIWNPMCMALKEVTCLRLLRYLPNITSF